MILSTVRRFSTIISNRVVVLGAVVIIAATSLSCQSLNHMLRTDSQLAYNPTRHWRISVGHEQDRTRPERIYVIKEFRYYAASAEEKKLFKELRQSFSDDKLFFIWIESRLRPLNTNDVLQSSEFFSEAGADAFVMRFKTREPVLKTDELGIDDLSLPDPLLELAERRCHDETIGYKSPGDALGIELVLASTGPMGEVIPFVPWQYEEHRAESLLVKSWSFAAKDKVIYRALLQTTKGYSPCPLPAPMAALIKTSIEKFVFLAQNSAAESWWQQRLAALPVLRGQNIENYLGAVSAAVNDVINYAATPTSKNRFSLAMVDTLNPTIWSQGNGYFIIHGGLVERASKDNAFLFLLALELVQESLSLKPTDIKPVSIPIISALFFNDGTPNLWTPDGFATLALNDPIVRRGGVRSFEEETKSLNLVATLFNSLGLDYKTAAQAVVHILEHNAGLKGRSSLMELHPQLSRAIKEVRPSSTPVNAALLNKYGAYLTPEYFRKVQSTWNGQTKNKYPWFAELAPFVELIRSPAASLESSIARVRWKLGKEAQSESVSWIENKLRLVHNAPAEVIKNLDPLLQKRPDLSPHQLLRAQAKLAFSEDLKHCEDLQIRWLNYDNKREQYFLHCLLLVGQLTKAKQWAEEHYGRYPYDPQAMFWSIWTKYRLREPEAHELTARAESLWGDRPVVMALKLYSAAINQNQAAVYSLVDRVEQNDFSSYPLNEQGMLDFMVAYALFPYKNYKWKNYITQAQTRFHPAKAYGRLLPFLPPPPESQKAPTKFTR